MTRPRLPSAVRLPEWRSDDLDEAVALSGQLHNAGEARCDPDAQGTGSDAAKGAESAKTDGRMALFLCALCVSLRPCDGPEGAREDEQRELAGNREMERTWGFRGLNRLKLHINL